MCSLTMPVLAIGELRATVPIVQGGMGVGVSLSNLASAVANCGGIGVLSTIGIGFLRPGYMKNPIENCVEAMREEIRKARAKTAGILGINLMVASSHFENEADTAIREGVNILFAGAGLPMDLPRHLLEGAKTKLVPIVSSARAAALLIRRWIERYRYAPDAIVVEGPMAGGHLGFRKEQIFDPEYALEKIIPEVVKEAKRAEEEAGHPIPVIAGGGVFTGEDIAHMLSLGASGVQMGTRFVATEECDASLAFKEAFVRCVEEDIGIIESPVGLPGRAMMGSFLRDVAEGQKKPDACPYKCLKTCDVKKAPYCISRALIQARNGHLDNGFVFCGQNAHRVQEIVPVRALIEELSQQYAAAVADAQGGKP